MEKKGHLLPMSSPPTAAQSQSLSLGEKGQPFLSLSSSLSNWVNNSGRFYMFDRACYVDYGFFDCWEDILANLGFR